jgi:hypothetical protein
MHQVKQQARESTRAFAARVKEIAANCGLTKTCPAPNCDAAVSFTDETVTNVVMAGLHNPDVRERALTASYMKRINNLKQLVKFCSAEGSRAPTRRTRLTLFPGLQHRAPSA